jgi:hypothetical protein
VPSPTWRVSGQPPPSRSERSSSAEDPGYEVVAASSLPLDFFFDTLVTPDGIYHEFWTLRRRDEGEALARRA